MHTIRLSMESRKSIFRIETLSEEINPDWAIVFRSCFKDKLVNHLESKERGKNHQLIRGASNQWLQHSAMQASLYLPLVSNDERIREMIVDLLKSHFEFINKSYSSLNPSKNSLSHSEMYRLAYPLQLAYHFYLRTEEISQFSLLFSSASSRILDVWSAGADSSDKEVITEKELMMEVIQYMEEIFSNITRHTDLKNQALNLKKLLDNHDEIFAPENYELFHRGVSAATYREKEHVLNCLVKEIKEEKAKDSITELLFCQLLLNYFKV
jgi:meiotically up-regulated gene 157 (Mug157) protein